MGEKTLASGNVARWKREDSFAIAAVSIDFRDPPCDADRDEALALLQELRPREAIKEQLLFASDPAGRASLDALVNSLLGRSSN